MKEENRPLYTHNIKVRVDDINYGNHLCHSKLISIIHDARAHFLMKKGVTELNCFGLALIMLGLNIDYLSECFFGDDLEIDIFVKSFEKVKIEFSYLVFNRTLNKIAAKATTFMGFYNKEKSRISRIPEEFKILMKETKGSDLFSLQAIHLDSN